MAEGILGEICRERAADAAAAKRARPASSLERKADAPRPCFADAAERSAAAPSGATPAPSGATPAPSGATPAPSGATPAPSGAAAPNGGADAAERSAAAPSGAAAEGAGILIAECKKASPSRGLIVRDYDPSKLARSYERGGAAMVSVLTEPRHFLGSDEHLIAVRASVGLPVLRKDFVVDEYQLFEAWAIGADAALLIVAALGKAQLFELAACGLGLGLSVLVETRDEAEIEVALELASALAPRASAFAERPGSGQTVSRNAPAAAIAIGVNARDLRDFSVDHGRAAHLARLLADAPFAVAESGLKRPEEAAALLAAGFRGFLVGEALASATDPAEAARAFVAAIGGAAPSGSAAPRGAAGTAR